MRQMSLKLYQMNNVNKLTNKQVTVNSNELYVTIVHMQLTYTKINNVY